MAISRRSGFHNLQAALASPCYVGSLGPFLTLNYFELDGIAFCEALISVGCNGAIVNKNIGPALSS